MWDGIIAFSISRLAIIRLSRLPFKKKKEEEFPTRKSLPITEKWEFFGEILMVMTVNMVVKMFMLNVERWNLMWKVIGYEGYGYQK